MNWDPRALDVLARLHDAGHQAVLVGGCVRDRLLSVPLHDYDAATSARPEEILSACSGLRCLETGLKHGTVTVFSDGLPVEVTTFRRETTYSDHRHPDAVEFTDDLTEDLARRDFTINAMAFHPERGLRDLFGGREDLERGRIRCVGEAKKRFREDALRILRALRFAARFGFEIECDTAGAMHREAPLLCILSVERVLTELRGILCEKGAGALLEEFADVFRVILPELKEFALIDRAPADFALRMAMLLGEETEPVLRRLKCDNATRQAAVRLSEGLRCAPPRTLPEMRRVVGAYGAEAAALLAAVQGTEGLLQETLALGGPFRVKELAVSGAELGMEAGPAIGEALQKLLEAVWDDCCENKREALLDYAGTLLSGSLR